MTETLAARIARQLRVQLAHRDMTQGNLAELMGMSPQSLSERFSGGTEWRVSELLRAAEVLGIDPVILIPTYQPTTAGGAR